MLEASEKLGGYMDICHDNPVALTPLAVERLMEEYKRHLVLMAPVGLFRAEAPPDAALDAPRSFFFFRESLVDRQLARRRAQPRFEARAEELPPALFRGAGFHEAWKRA